MTAELYTLAALLPTFVANLFRKPLDHIYCSDACTKGYAVHRAKFEHSELDLLSQVREKWRFKPARPSVPRQLGTQSAMFAGERGSFDAVMDTLASPLERLQVEETLIVCGPRRCWPPNVPSIRMATKPISAPKILARCSVLTLFQAFPTSSWIQDDGRALWSEGSGRLAPSICWRPGPPTSLCYMPQPNLTPWANSWCPSETICPNSWLQKLVAPLILPSTPSCGRMPPWCSLTIYSGAEGIASPNGIPRTKILGSPWVERLLLGSVSSSTTLTSSWRRSKSIRLVYFDFYHQAAAFSTLAKTAQTYLSRYQRLDFALWLTSIDIILAAITPSTTHFLAFADIGWPTVQSGACGWICLVWAITNRSSWPFLPSLCAPFLVSTVSSLPLGLLALSCGGCQTCPNVYADYSVLVPLPILCLRHAIQTVYAYFH